MHYCELKRAVACVRHEKCGLKQRCATKTVQPSVRHGSRQQAPLQAVAVPVYSLLCSCLAVSDASDAQPYGVLLMRHIVMRAWKHVCLGLGMSTHEQHCSRFNLLGSQASALALHGPTLALQHSKAQYNTAHAGQQAHSARRSTDSDEGLRLFPLHQRHSHRRTAKHTMQSKEAKEYAEGRGEGEGGRR